MTDAPARFQHDCADCTYLGQQEEADLYHCPQGGLPTVIARTGPGAQYVSGMALAGGRTGIYPALAEARLRALTRGLRCTPVARLHG